jgi:hypothetical protein
MRVPARATARVTKAGAGVVTTPVAAVGDDAVVWGAVELVGGAVELAGGAVELAAPLHPADTTARQAPAIAATTSLRRIRTSTCMTIP